MDPKFGDVAEKYDYYSILSDLFVHFVSKWLQNKICVCFYENDQFYKLKTLEFPFSRVCMQGCGRKIRLLFHSVRFIC